jgi:hypothetical protein
VQPAQYTDFFDTDLKENNEATAYRGRFRPTRLFGWFWLSPKWLLPCPLLATKLLTLGRDPDRGDFRAEAVTLRRVACMVLACPSSIVMPRLSSCRKHHTYPGTITSAKSCRHREDAAVPFNLLIDSSGFESRYCRVL